jgi:general secretion pathway protein N
VKRTVWLIIFGVLVFAGFIVARMPVSWVFPDEKSGVSCGEIDGTIWSGSCTGLTVASVQSQPLGDLTWNLHALRLLAAKLNADVVLTRSGGGVQGNIEAGMNKSIDARDVKIDLPLDQQLAASFLPPNLRGLRAQLHADLNQLHVEGGRVLKSIQGLVEVHDLTDGEGAAAERLGSYSLTFPPPSGGDPVGQIRDLGGTGPLSVEGTLKLTSEPGFDLEGLVAARPSAAPDLANDLRILGSPDAQGRRPFSLAGTF